MPLINVYVSAEGRDLGGVLTDVQKIAKTMEHEKPRSAEVEIHGQASLMHDAYFELIFGLLAAIVLVYLLIVVNFQSWLDPFIIITALPGALAGIAWALFLSHTRLSEPALTGAIMDRKDEIGNLTKVIHTMSTQLRAHLGMVEKSEAELRSVNRDLSASEAKYRSLVDLAPFGIFSTKGFDVTFSNRHNRILAGLDPDGDENPDAFRQWIHPEDRERVLTEFARAVQERKPYETVFRFLHQNGTMRKVLSRRIPLEQEPGQTVVYQGFNIDITALDDMQQQLSRAERLATLGQVAAGIAHEIRNPLVGIGSTAALLRDEFEPSDEKRTDLDIILNETRRLDRIVNQIIDYARPRDLVPTTWLVEGLIEEVLKLLDTRLETQQVMSAHGKGPCQRFENASGNFARILHVPQIGQQHRKLIAAEACQLMRTTSVDE